MAHQIDTYVGQRITCLRTRAGVSRKTMARALGISAVMLFRHEKATSPCPLARLCRIAEILNCEITAFMPDRNSDQMAPSAMRLVRACSRLDDPKLSVVFADLIEACSSPQTEFAELVDAASGGLRPSLGPLCAPGTEAAY